MTRNSQWEIRFPQGVFDRVGKALLADPSREAFSVLFARKESIGPRKILNVIDCLMPSGRDYIGQGLAMLRLRKEFVRDSLAELQARYDADTIIDVHTHPFMEGVPRFSGTDDNDERTFMTFLSERLAISDYGSVVLSRNGYSARVWTCVGGEEGPGLPTQSSARVKTPSCREIGCWKSSFDEEDMDAHGYATQDRSVRVLGLDAMRRIAGKDRITIVGAGGLGSVAAEHLVHTGFRNITLIDHDRLELSNMNRIVGATYQDAAKGRHKVSAIRDHLRKINPEANIEALYVSVEHRDARESIAESDWVLVCTDNHSSRVDVQSLCMRYYIPFITLGVNITSRDGFVADMSGEVITIRPGDGVCLNCLGRVDYTKLAHESNPSETVRSGLVQKGYVSGADIPEPAVKTLNTYIATLAVDTLVNQYTGLHRHSPLLVFEFNEMPRVYEDTASLQFAARNCFVCG